jgi:hypothetical protein
MSYRPPIDGIGTCRQCGADVADGVTFCPECGARQLPAHGAAPSPAPVRRQWWMPVAIGIGGLAAIGGGALLAIALNGRPDTTAANPSASAAVSQGASESGSPAASASSRPEVTPSPTPEAAAAFPNRAIVAVGTEALNIRSEPNESASVLGELDPGQRLFIIGEPTDQGELRWYRVGVVAGQACDEECNLLGYVATPVLEEADAWIDDVSITCPSSPMTSEALGALGALEALHCYGRNEIVVTGTIETPCCGYVGPLAFSPEWLAHPVPPAFFIGAANQALGFRANPDADLEPPERGDVVRVTGHFEDPAATSCRHSIDDTFWGGASPEPVQMELPARVVLDCRATFVWTDYEVTGHEDLGPCCGSLPGFRGSPTTAIALKEV